MALKCDGCNEVFDNEDSLAVFTDMPELTKRIGNDGITLCGECPLCGGLVQSIAEELPHRKRPAA